MLFFVCYVGYEYAMCNFTPNRLCYVCSGENMNEKQQLLVYLCYRYVHIGCRYMYEIKQDTWETKPVHLGVWR